MRVPSIHREEPMKTLFNLRSDRRYVHTLMRRKAPILGMILLTSLLSGCGLIEIFGEALGGVCRRPLVITTAVDKNDGACTP